MRIRDFQTAAADHLHEKDADSQKDYSVTWLMKKDPADHPHTACLHEYGTPIQDCRNSRENRENGACCQIT